MRMPRIQLGGVVPNLCFYIFLSLMTCRRMNINTTAILKPKAGEISSDWPILLASFQFTPTFSTLSWHQAERNANAQQGAYQGMGTRARDAKIPSADVPNYRCHQYRNDHCDAVMEVLPHERLHGQQVGYLYCHCHAEEVTAQYYSQEVPDTRPDNGSGGL